MKPNKSSLYLLLVLTFLALEGIYQSTFGQYDINPPFFYSIAVTATCWILYFGKSKNLKTALFVALILGFLNIVSFTYYTVTFGYRIELNTASYSTLGFHPLLFFLLLYYIIANKTEAKAIIQSVTKGSSKEIEANSQGLKDRFKNKLKTESDEKLEKICQHPNDFQPEYVEAAKELLDERKSNEEAAL